MARRLPTIAEYSAVRSEAGGLAGLQSSFSNVLGGSNKAYWSSTIDNIAGCSQASCTITEIYFPNNNAHIGAGTTFNPYVAAVRSEPVATTSDPVPEPASLALAALGAGAMTTRRRRPD